MTGKHQLPRCSWPGDDPLYREYHDAEWGRAATEDRVLFEKVVLEGFQAGLSWITILRKRPAFREVFAGFDPVQVSGFGPADVERLMGDARIVRHRGKIQAAIGNASRALEIIEERGSMAAYLWPFAPGERPVPRSSADLNSETVESRALSKDLKRRGWRFVGPTTMHALMQAMGMVNDHLERCFVRGECEPGRLAALRDYGAAG